VAGSVEYVADDQTVWSLALLQAQVPNQGDAWTSTVDQLTHLLQSSDTESVESGTAIGAMARRIQVLARRVAQLHVALAQRTGEAAFDPEPVQPEDLEHWAAEVRANARRTLDLLAQRQAQLPEALAMTASRLVDSAPRLLARVELALRSAHTGVKTRIHGDLHLAQVLVVRDDFLLIDFEGEPLGTLDERRAKQSALRDVAGMLRSFDYARHTALHQAATTTADLQRLAPQAHRWEQQVRAAFLQSYAETVVAAGLYANHAAFQAGAAWLEVFELKKALYELRYELDNRPDWVTVPLAAIAALVVE
jgi:maltose alpha-D-glucosyltransferase/alpha-amylase